MKPNNAPTMVDLFCGCGGLTAGFKAAGFRVLAAVEIDPVATATYQLNHPEVRLYEADIRSVSAEEMMRHCDLKPGELTVLAACAPCQPFSRHNRSGDGDERAKLILETVRFLEVFRPVFLFVENVPGIKRKSEILHRLLAALRRSGYRTSLPVVIDAVDYGVPQFRKRFILLATRLDIELGVPEPTHAPPERAALLGKRPWRTVGEAFEGLEELDSGGQSETDPLHKARKHSPLNLERLRHIPPNGGSRDSLPIRLRPPCHKNKNVGYHDVYGRMSLDKPANTLTTGCTNFTKGRFAHPISDRSITLREAARLQTFPDSYRFSGSYEQISAQIGNAVPVKLAEAFARHFRMIWENWRDNSGANATSPRSGPLELLSPTTGRRRPVAGSPRAKK